jgi:hypothetical protein
MITDGLLTFAQFRRVWQTRNKHALSYLPDADVQEDACENGDSQNPV